MKTNKTRAILLSSSIAVGVLAVLMLGLFAGAAQAQDGPPSCASSGTTVEFQGVTGPDANGHYTWSYTVCQEGFALSHWVLGLCPCFSDTQTIEFVGYIDAEGNETVLPECNGEEGQPCYSLGYDPTTMLYGLKWDNLGEADSELTGECWTFYLTVNQDLAEEELDWTSKYDACEPGTGTVTGPACPCDDDCGQVFAFKYYDVDKDGIYDADAGDYPLDGWEMTLSNGTEESGTTDDNGIVEFGCVPSDTYTVCETLKVGWWNTDPSEPDVQADTVPISVCEQVTINTGDQKTVEFGNYEDEQQQDSAYIRGFKYHDVDGSGAYDNDDHPLNDWEICLQGDGEDCKLTCDTCGGSGGYTGYWEVEPGTYTLCETLEQDWVNSDPGDGTLCKSVTVAAGDYETLVFGNWQYATKSGYKYEDLDADGDLDDDVEPVNGVTIYLIEGGQVVASAMTGDGSWADGYYEFDEIVPGVDYLVCEEDVSPPWTQSYPDNDACAAVVDPAVEDGGYSINLKSSETDDDNDFGNWQYATKSGKKFEDVNGSGVYEAGTDNLLGDWVIDVWTLDADGEPETKVFSDTTEAGTGAYAFDMLTPGQDYLVCEVLEEGWEQSYPTMSTTDAAACPTTLGYAPYGYKINLDSDQVDDDNDFGNWQYATKSGKKFHDRNGDGVQDEGEESLPGWTIALLSSDGSTVEETDITNATGAYSLTKVIPGQDYLVCEVLQDGWRQVYPTADDAPDGAAECPEGYGPWGWSINLESGELEENNNFGNDPIPVGGTSRPITAMALLAPWLGLVALVGLLLMGTVILWRRKATQ